MSIPSSNLSGKLSSPSMGVKTLVRTRLYQQIDQSLKNAVTMIVAPAGFGKTVLLSGWMAQCSLPTAWISLDAQDNELSTFVRRVGLAVERLFSKSCRETLSLVDSLYPPTLSQLTDCMLTEIGDLPESAILILDDFHLLNKRDIQTLVASLIEHLSERLHLVIGSRIDPSLPLARWRLNGQLGEIRLSDLRFSLYEVRELLELLLGVEVPSSVNEAIAARTEGWAAGLRLTALSLQGQADLNSIPYELLGRHRYIMDYLMEEVFVRQTPAVQGLLVRSSILEWMSEPLLAALISTDVHLRGDAPPDAAPASLPQLLKAGVFIELVSEYEGKYRYHDLFRDLLRQRLIAQATPQDITALHREASRWLAENGYFEEAVRHAIAADELLTAARVVEGHIHALLNQEAKRKLESLLNLLPVQVSEARAPLLIGRAWLMHFEQRLTAVLPLLQQAEQILQESEGVSDAEARQWQGDILTLRSQAMFWQSHILEARDLGWQAVTLILPTSHFARGLAFFYTALSTHATGDTDTALQLLREHLEQSTPLSAAADLRLLLGLCVIQQDSLRIEQLQSAALTMLRLATAGDFPISRAWAHNFAGRAYYEVNDLKTAQFHFLAGVALRHMANGMCTHECMTGLALTYAAQGQWRRAMETADTLIEFDASPLSVERLVHSQALKARIALLSGDLETGRRWSLRSDMESVPDQLALLEIATATRSRVLLATENIEDAQRALEWAQQLQRDGESISSKWRLVLALTLQALALDALDAEERALDLLQNAIELGQPGRLIRTFVDFGPALGNLLQRLLQSGRITHQDTRSYTALLLAEFPAVPSAASKTDGSLIEPLTTREEQVLELVAQRLSDREIADTLVISPFTVRRHLDNIGEKIGVRSRRAMVEHSRRLGLLPAKSV